MIRCWFFHKLMAGKVGDDSPLPEWASAHVKHCEACRRFHRSEMQLTERLRSLAEEHRQEISPFLHGKIISSLERRSIGETPSRRVHPLAWASIAALACLVFLGLRLLNVPPTLSPVSQPITPTTSGIESAAASADLVKGRKLSEWSSLLEKPLETEMRLVWSDARSTAQFLAREFLPAD